MPFTPTRDMIGSNAVNLLLRDLLNPGDTVFDVGAYVGWVTELMSRLVGPRGSVVAFEPVPENMDACLARMLQCGTSNYTLINAAVCDRDGMTSFFVDRANAQVSALAPEHPDNCTKIHIPAITLDAYVRANRLSPSVIKVDTERAELAVLHGAISYLRWHRPILVMEQDPHDQSCAELLREFGYIGIDASDYLIFNNRQYPAAAANVDVLYFHPEVGRLDISMFARRSVIPPTEPAVSVAGTSIICGPFELERGRYVLSVDFDPGPNHGRISQRIVANGRVFSKDDGQKHWLHRSYRHIPIHLHRPTSVFLEYHDIDDGALSGMTCKTIGIDAFPGLARMAKINEY